MKNEDWFESLLQRISELGINTKNAWQGMGGFRFTKEYFCPGTALPSNTRSVFLKFPLFKDPNLRGKHQRYGASVDDGTTQISPTNDIVYFKNNHNLSLPENQQKFLNLIQYHLIDELSTDEIISKLGAGDPL